MKTRAVEKLLGIKLTPTQRRYFAAVRWMMTDPLPYGRCTGRSYVIAVMYIEEALKNLGNYVHYRDNYPSKRANDNLGDTIHMIIKGNPVLLNNTVFGKGKFCILNRPRRKGSRTIHKEAVNMFKEAIGETHHTSIECPHCHKKLRVTHLETDICICPSCGQHIQVEPEK